MKIVKLVLFSMMMFGLAACGTDDTSDTSQLDGPVSLKPIAGKGLTKQRVEKLATNPVAISDFDKSKYNRGDRITYQQSRFISALRRDIKCSDNGRVCLECYYKSNGDLLYCDIWVLPALKLKNF